MEGQPQKRPYAPPANVRSVLERARSRNLPEVIDGDFLRLAGVSENLFTRVLEALRFLGLIDEAGRPTETLRSLSAAPDEEYKAALAGAIREAYEADFGRIDPAQDTQAQIVDAFRPYQPRSQHKRMVMLFLGLCREAGIPVKEAPRDRQMAGGKASPRKRPDSKKLAPPSPPPPRQQQAAVGAPEGALFGVTEADIALLDESEFDEVWSALGRVAQARARAIRAKDSGSATETARVEKEDGDES